MASGTRSRAISRGRRNSKSFLALVLLLGKLCVWLYPLSNGYALTVRSRARPPKPLCRGTALQQLTAAEAGAPPKHSSFQPPPSMALTLVSEQVWRAAAEAHRTRIHDLLRPGLVAMDHPLMGPVRKYYLDGDADAMTMLDPEHPVYNFLVEYYGLKGLKGPKRLARWAPSPGLFFWDDGSSSSRSIESLKDYHRASQAYNHHWDTEHVPSIHNHTGIFLEGATPEDLALTLYLQGAEWVDGGGAKGSILEGRQGILYQPIRYFDSNKDQDTADDTDEAFYHRRATSFAWYRSILASTLANEPVLHCYGLHEWAMQYHPEGHPPPPSGKYQSHLPLRVSRETINETVERRGLRCTHVDALRFFAPAAGPLNFHGSSLERTQQPDLEQPGCVHAHMDLLKIALRLKPYIDPELLGDVLEVALQARTLDVGASPYDCSGYGCDADGTPVPIVPVETPEGRSMYQRWQTRLLEQAEGVRQRLLANYDAFGSLAFCPGQLERATQSPTDERYATAEPGGKAWRHNLVDRPDAAGPATAAAAKA